MYTSDEIIKQALKSDSFPEDYNLIELKFYLDMKKILTMFYNDEINKEVAARLKALAIKDYERTGKEFGFYKDLYISYSKSNCMNEILEKKEKLRNAEDKDEQLKLALDIIKLYGGGRI